MRRINTVIFDLDQTLLDKDQSLVNFSIYQYQHFSLHRFISDRDIFINKFKELNNIVMPKEEVYEKLVNSLGIERELYAGLLDDLNNNFHLYSVGFPGLQETLRWLKAKGYKLGLVSNGRVFYQRNKIKALGITEYFDDIVISGAVNLRKPDHAIFQLALSNLNAQVECTVFVGDNLEAVIIPSKELGMFTH